MLHCCRGLTCFHNFGTGCWNKTFDGSRCSGIGFRLDGGRKTIGNDNVLSCFCNRMPHTAFMLKRIFWELNNSFANAFVTVKYNDSATSCPSSIVSSHDSWLASSEAWESSPWYRNIGCYEGLKQGLLVDVPLNTGLGFPCCRPTGPCRL